MPREVVYLLAGLIVAAAGVLKGSIGFGAPLVAIALLAMLVGIRTAVILGPIPWVLANLVLLLRRPVDRAAVRRFLPIMVTLVPATFLGSVLLATVNTAALSTAIGVITLAFVALTVAGAHLRVPTRAERPASLLLGAGAGVLNGSTSIPGPLFVIYLTGLALDQRAFVYGITLLLLAGNVAQVVSYAGLGLYSTDRLLGSLALAPAFLLGQQLGFRIHDRLDPVRFRRIVLVVVTLSGANLLARGLGWL